MSALSRLAEFHGIALEYHDVWGTPHAVAEATLRSLLVAMDVAAVTDGEVEHTLAACIAKRWREIVAPVVVVRDRSQPKVRVHLTAAWDAAGPSRYIYGAIRFLPAPYSSFQVIRGSGDELGAALIQQITAVVNSWKQ